MSSTGSKSQMKKSSSTRTTRSQVSAKSSTGKTAAVKPSTSGTSATKAPPKKYELPALSVQYVPKVTESELDKLKKRAIRRNAPPGEDLKCIKTILQSTKQENITVQEFISRIAPSTGDKGECLRQVMNEDLAAFRKLARKVYDTITQDNSDVLLNQQMQLSEYYREKKILLNNKMMRMIQEIFEMAPNFSFDQYAKEGQKYLEKILPIPPEVTVEPEEIEMMKRQATYHRLQWLRSEGERLNEENNSLKKRLNQMKKLHMEEQRRMVEIEKMAEAKKEDLEDEEAEKQEILETLNKSLEKTIIAQEKSIRESADASVLQPTTGAVRKTTSKPKVSKVKRPKRPKWNEAAAADIESRVLDESKKVEKRKVVKKDPFHFSPIKTPPPKSGQPRELSPFHYSPPRSPVAEARYVTPPPPRAPSPRQPPPEQFTTQRGRRTQAPRDSWGGFY